MGATWLGHISNGHQYSLAGINLDLFSVQPTTPSGSEEGKSKKYSCCFCKKQFSAPSRLIVHERMHTGEKPYKCSSCGKCFSRLYSMQVHERIHTGEKPYKCDTCNKCFSRLYHLQGHERIHTGEKPYKCEQCGRCFSTSGNLRSHQVTHKKRQIDELKTKKNDWFHTWQIQAPRS